MRKGKNIFTLCILLVVIPMVVILGAFVFREKHYLWISLCVAVLSFVPMLYAFEHRENTSRELMVLSVMVALSVMGRFVFAWVPGFKPVTAITIIAGIYLGKESGFLIGALTAVVSNFYFGQGPWTPFQMLAWGLIGLCAGLLHKSLEKRKVLLCIFGFFAGVFYSLSMDVWTTLWLDGTFNFTRYLASVVSALPITAEYALSNIIFLLLLSKPIAQKLTRIKTKYGLFIPKQKSQTSSVE